MSTVEGPAHVLAMPTTVVVQNQAPAVSAPQASMNLQASRPRGILVGEEATSPAGRWMTKRAASRLAESGP